MWLLAAFSSVTGLDTDLPCDSEGLHGSHTAGLCPACNRRGKQALVTCQDHTSPMAETPNCGYATHGVTPGERGWDRGLLAGLVKGCTTHPECKNKQRWATQ